MKYSGARAAVVGLTMALVGCGATPGDLESESGSEEGTDGAGEVGTAAQELWTSCSPIFADIFDHVDAGRAHDCGFLEYCATGSEQVIGNLFTLEWQTLSETNPGYWVKGSCLPKTTFRFPLDYTNYVVQQYLDRDATAGLLDYRGGKKTYDAHTGVDIAVANFRQQDAGVNVLAGAAGVVVDFLDTADDRNIDLSTCAGKPQNFVRIRHANGSEALYYHIRKGSASARIYKGKAVAAGAAIAQVGSSGCSSNPHLHFEVREYSGGGVSGPVLDPFGDGLLQSPPAYSAPMALMDVAFLSGNQTGDARRQIDPGPNATTIARGSAFTAIAYSGNGLVGDRLRFRVLNSGGGEIFVSDDIRWTAEYTRMYWAWTGTIPTTVNTQGEFKAEFIVNGLLRRTLRFRVTP